MATEAEQQTTDDGIEIVLDNPDDGDAIQIVLDKPGDDNGGIEIVVARGESDDDERGTVAVDPIAAIGADTSIDRPQVEVVVVEDAYITADHADAAQVFAAAARLRPLFAALSIVMVVCVALAVYGVSALLVA